MSGMEVFLGQYEQAAAHAAEGAQRARQYGFHFGEAICLWVLGLRSLLTDDAGGARKSLQDGLQVAQSVSAAWVIANLFDSFALLALFTGQGESAFRLFGAANAAHHWAGWVRIPPFQAMYMDLLKQPREELGSDLCEGLVREGEQMELEAAIAYALRT